MIAAYDADRWRQGVGDPVASWTDEVVPNGVEPLPHGSYSPVYAWMFAYEKRLRSRIEKALGRRLGSLERRLFGPDGAFSEGLSNAFLHGHRRNPSLPIRVSCTVGRTGLSFAIRDGGPGFDASGALEALEKGASYFHMAGNGLRCFVEASEIVASHIDGGRTLCLLVPFRPLPGAEGGDGGSNTSTPTSDLECG